MPVFTLRFLLCAGSGFSAIFPFSMATKYVASAGRATPDLTLPVAAGARPAGVFAGASGVGGMSFGVEAAPSCTFGMAARASSCNRMFSCFSMQRSKAPLNLLAESEPRGAHRHASCQTNSRMHIANLVEPTSRTNADFFISISNMIDGKDYLPKRTALIKLASSH